MLFACPNLTQIGQNMETSIAMINAKTMQKLRNFSYPEFLFARGIKFNPRELEEALTILQLDAEKKNQGEGVDVDDGEVGGRLGELEDQDNNPILPSTRLIYNQLPPSLKQCFAYCWTFPRDYEFRASELVSFWMANGLLPSLGVVEDPEGVGLQYLKMLRSKSVFNYLGVDDFDAKFKMQGSMHDLASLVASNEFGLKKNFTNDFGHSGSTHYFSISNPKALKLEEDAHKLQNHIQSLMFFQSMATPFRKSLIEAYISKCQYLRTLILMDCGFKELPKGIDDLKHLKYLNLSGNEELSEIPNSLCKLQTLQTLMLQGCLNIFKSMAGLRMLTITTKQSYLPENGISSLNSLWYLSIIGCRNLKYLPQGIYLLTSLRTLVIRDCEELLKLPRSIKYMVVLETLVIENCKMLQLNSKDELLGFRVEDHDEHQIQDQTGFKISRLYKNSKSTIALFCSIRISFAILGSVVRIVGKLHMCIGFI
ncbi:hypothetical protein CCACVL1_18271 [Corchorus capsularis]|uniref:Disease resistance protein winged helix domain-containing protein n=1 Tax=Corchorus capsularis TaxID=210143 RepID=A0A1R3HLN2_COCAP|nr:hypothetical protein CCACVL1_18271 [Corchorus capsularis]